MKPIGLNNLLNRDPLVAMRAAIINTVRVLLPDLSVMIHSDKSDMIELSARTIDAVPSVGIGWTGIRRMALAGGSTNLTVEWSAYITARDMVLDGKRVEKVRIGSAIGLSLLAILSDQVAALWGLSSVMPPEETPAPEFKPLLTMQNATPNAACYSVTWTQVCADIGAAYPVASSAFQGKPGSEPDWQAISAVLRNSDA